MTDPTMHEQREMNPILRGAAIFALLFILSVTIGFLHGYTENILQNDRPFSAGMALKYVAAIVVAVSSIWGMFHLIRPIFKRTNRGTAAWKTRTGRINLMMLAILLIGLVSGIAFSASGIDIFNPINTDAAITPVFAIASAIIATIALFAFNSFYRRNVDEMELNAVFEASYWSVNFYVFAMPVGGLFWKAGLFGTMPSWPIFWITITIYCFVYLWKKYF